MFGVFDIYFLQAVIDGVLLGGVFALLALGLNLIFGVIDVVWICYGELLMAGMYGMYYLYSVYHLPFVLAALASIAIVGLLGVLLHLLVISPLLGTAPINQLLATGGVLFLLQSAATVLFGIDFRNLGIRLPILDFAGMYLSYARLIAFLVALAGMAGLYLFLSRSYIGTAIRAIAQDRQIMPLMGVDTRRVYIVTSAIGGGLAGLAATILVLQYDVQPFVGLTFAPITFLVCVLGGLGNMLGGSVAAIIFAEILSISGLYLDLEWGYVFAFGIFVVLMFFRPQGLLARRS
ncbi:MAG TPA: branched-chain amino acid ABC transporter permease [Stellaceae bacterium]|nr:branched-chain amino acid ABC transporter permease [Stellaceae bacterium]